MTGLPISPFSATQEYLPASFRVRFHNVILLCALAIVSCNGPSNVVFAEGFAAITTQEIVAFCVSLTTGGITDTDSLGTTMN